MAVAKCDSGADAKNGGAVVNDGGSTSAYNDRAQTYSDPTALRTNEVAAGRHLAGDWRGEVLPASASDHHAPAANTAAVVTYAAEDYRRHVIFGVAYSYSAAPTNGSIKVASPSGTTLFEQAVTAAGPDEVVFPEGLKGAVGEALVVTLAAGSGTVVGKVTVTGRRVE